MRHIYQTVGVHVPDVQAVAAAAEAHVVTYTNTAARPHFPNNPEVLP